MSLPAGMEVASTPRPLPTWTPKWHRQHGLEGHFLPHFLRQRTGLRKHPVACAELNGVLARATTGRMVIISGTCQLQSEEEACNQQLWAAPIQ